MTRIGASIALFALSLIAGSAAAQDATASVRAAIVARHAAAHDAELRTSNTSTLSAIMSRHGVAPSATAADPAAATADASPAVADVAERDASVIIVVERDRCEPSDAPEPRALLDALLSASPELAAAVSAGDVRVVTAVFRSSEGQLELVE